MPRAYANEYNKEQIYALKVTLLIVTCQKWSSELLSAGFVKQKGMEDAIFPMFCLKKTVIITVMEGRPWIQNKFVFSEP
jgi:hypothetical protein